ncbi:MAG: ABC transporter ATP-binding protein [Firmicutes bacterium]|nr:ABC transporter ATP-binding protein [Bacillota bacterium]
MTEAAIQVQHLVKFFAAGRRVFTALQDVTLDIHEGEFFVILGTSGCGKTTLLRCLAGLEKPSGGEVYVYGKKVRSPGADRALVFQEAMTFPWRTVQKNIEFSLEIRGVSTKERRMTGQHYLNLVGLEGFADCYPHQLSGGMRQRLSLAMQLAHRPRILLMDEPFASLDSLTRRSMQEELLAIWLQNGMTVVFVTHLLDEAVFLGDRVLIMGQGGVVEQIIDLNGQLSRGKRNPESRAFRLLLEKLSAALKESEA